MSGGVSSFSSDYKPYGNAYQKTGTLVFGYTGKRYDNSIGGLYYYNARWYDPDYGRFITEDTKNGTRDNPTSLNRYVYVKDNPEGYVDPTGHDALPPSGGLDPTNSALLAFLTKPPPEVLAPLYIAMSAGILLIVADDRSRNAKPDLEERDSFYGGMLVGAGAALFIQPEFALPMLAAVGKYVLGRIIADPTLLTEIPFFKSIAESLGFVPPTVIVGHWTSNSMAVKPE